MRKHFPLFFLQTKVAVQNRFPCTSAEWVCLSLSLVQMYPVHLSHVFLYFTYSYQSCYVPQVTGKGIWPSRKLHVNLVVTCIWSPSPGIRKRSDKILQTCLFNPFSPNDAFPTFWRYHFRNYVSVAGVGSIAITQETCQISLAPDDAEQTILLNYHG